MTGSWKEDKGSYAFTPNTVELIPTLGALFPRDGPVQDPVLTRSVGWTFSVGRVGCEPPPCGRQAADHEPAEGLGLKYTAGNPNGQVHYISCESSFTQAIYMLGAGCDKRVCSFASPHPAGVRPHNTSLLRV